MPNDERIVREYNLGYKAGYSPASPKFPQPLASPAFRAGYLKAKENLHHAPLCPYCHENMRHIESCHPPEGEYKDIYTCHCKEADEQRLVVYVYRMP